MLFATERQSEVKHLNVYDMQAPFQDPLEEFLFDYFTFSIGWLT